MNNKCKIEMQGRKEGNEAERSNKCMGNKMNQEMKILYNKNIINEKKKERKKIKRKSLIRSSTRASFAK